MGKASRRKKTRHVLTDLEPNDRKVSTRLAELVEPHADPDETRESYEALVGIGAMAWNLSLMPAADRIDSIREAVRRAVAIGLPLTEWWLTELVERKLLLFPSDDRFIESFEVVEAPDDRFTVIVASLTAGN